MGEAVGKRARRQLLAGVEIRPTQKGNLAKIMKLQMYVSFDNSTSSSRNLSHKLSHGQNDPHARQFISALFVTAKSDLRTHPQVTGSMHMVGPC